MSEDKNENKEDLEQFLAKRKINLSELEEEERDKFDIEKQKARNIEMARIKAIPFSTGELRRMNHEIEYSTLQSIFDNCFEK